MTGLGYIGSALVGPLLARGERVVALENYYSTPRADVAGITELPGLNLIEGDVAEPADVARAFDACAPAEEPLTVYHLAAQPSAAMAVREPEYSERTNLAGARILLEAAQQRAARVVFGGSFRVYGDDLAGQTVDETTPYGRVGDLSHLSKMYVEQLGRMLGLQFISVRLGVCYGLAPVMKQVTPFMTVPNLFCQRAARGEVLNVLEDRPMGFIHVEDAARALVSAAEMPSVAGEAWQVVNAAPEVRTIGQVARIVQRHLQQRGRFVRVNGGSSDEPPSFDVRSRLDERGFTPVRGMAESLGEVLDRFLEHPA